MRHEYLKLVPENIFVTFTDIHFSERQGESITVHLERPNENGFDIAEYVLPVCYCKKCMGFTEDEEYKLRRFVEKNSPLIWEIAREDGQRDVASNWCAPQPLDDFNSSPPQNVTQKFLFDLYGYKIFFRSNENNEPIHVHVSKGKQSADATKIWLPPESNPVVAHNNSRIPQKDLMRILKSVALNRETIVTRWYDYFGR